MTRSDLYQSVTDRIVAALQAGTIPWVCPWQRSPDQALPANLGSGRFYRGINVMLLNLQTLANGYQVNRWLTYRQAQELGAQVRRGEQGTQIVFFKLHEVDADAAPTANQAAERKVVPLLRSFTVFNAAQIDGLPAHLLPQPQPAPWSPIESAAEVLTRNHAVIRHGGDRAFYNPGIDLIQLPEPWRFPSAEAYYATALHELTHWSGHPSRCNRPLQGRQHIEAYAFEELVAEMGSAFLCAHCGLQGNLQHASYVEHWLTALRSDRRLIFAAASLAQKACDWLLAFRAMPRDESAASPQPLAA